MMGYDEYSISLSSEFQEHAFYLKLCLLESNSFFVDKYMAGHALGMAQDTERLGHKLPNVQQNDFIYRPLAVNDEGDTPKQADHRGTG
jgi:hypothetical protein